MLPVATAQGPSFGSMQSHAAAGGFQPCGPAPWQYIMAGSGSVAAAVGAATVSPVSGGLTASAAGPGFRAAGPGLGAAVAAGQPAPHPLSLTSLPPSIPAGVSALPQGPAGSSAPGGQPAQPSGMAAGKFFARAKAAWANPAWGKQPGAGKEPGTAHGSSQGPDQGFRTAHGSGSRLAAGGAPGAAPGSMQAASGQPSHCQHGPVSALGSSGDQVPPQAALPSLLQQTTMAMGQAAAGLSAGPPGALALLPCLVHIPTARTLHQCSMHVARRRVELP